jgi:hypothetical protein
MTSAENTNPSVVLVHGAYADGSSWSEVIKCLQDAGIAATAVQNPLTSLADDVEIDSGHLSLVTHPEEVTALIMNAVQAVRSSATADATAQPI